MRSLPLVLIGCLVMPGAYATSLMNTSGVSTTGYVEAASFTISGTSIVPTGAVMAFDLSSCPTGWTEYTAARGRFLRGIDNGAGNDPSGTRIPGNTQEDLFKSHGHNISNGGAGTNGLAATSGSGADDLNFAFTDATTASTAVFKADAVGGAETRPKNVAVLFCRKN